MPKSSVTSKVRAKAQEIPPETAEPKKSDAETPQKLYVQALDSFNRGDYGMALNQLDGVLLKDPHFLAAYITKGDVYQARQETKLAIRNYKLALDNDPRLIKARLNLGQLYEEQGEYALARQEYNEVLRQSPQHSLAQKALQRIQGELERQAALSSGNKPPQTPPLPEPIQKSPQPARSLPKEYSQIAGTAPINRGQLAALLAVNLKIPADFLPASAQAVISDISDHWAREYILFAVRHNLMQEFPNHNFLPDANVSRAEMVEIANNILNFLGQSDERERPQIEYQDVPVKNQLYQPVMRMSSLGIIPPVSAQNFGLTQPLSCQEAQEIISRLSASLQKMTP